MKKLWLWFNNDLLWSLALAFWRLRFQWSNELALRRIVEAAGWRVDARVAAAREELHGRGWIYTWWGEWKRVGHESS